MANEKLDWFPVYWQRFIIGTLKMSAEEVGGYFLLLIHQWDKGFLPENEKELRKISRLSAKKLPNVLEKFENIHGKLYNNTLEIIRIEQTEKNEKNSHRGSKGAKARWDKYKEGIAQDILKHSLDDGIRKEKKRKEEEKNIVKQHLFEDSEFFDFEKFQEQFNGTDYEFCDLKIYYEKIKNWSAGAGKKKIDWIATARNFMLGDKEKGKLQLKNGVSNGNTKDSNFGTELDELIKNREHRRSASQG
jgi:uncharacterized protein YdaU (DUF1376 family)